MSNLIATDNNALVVYSPNRPLQAQQFLQGMEIGIRIGRIIANAATVRQTAKNIFAALNQLTQTPSTVPGSSRRAPHGRNRLYRPEPTKCAKMRKAIQRFMKNAINNPKNVAGILFNSGILAMNLSFLLNQLSATKANILGE